MQPDAVQKPDRGQLTLSRWGIAAVLPSGEFVSCMLRP